MSDLATQATHEMHGNHPEVQAAGDGLRFEKDELEFFVDDDRYTGAAIGKMLAFIFFILVFLMAGVAIWTNRHHFVGQDPFSPNAGSGTRTGAH